MPQAILPLFTEDITPINLHIGVQQRNGVVYYFQGCFPFYHHSVHNRGSFKTVVCQMITNGMATRSEISSAFHIPARSISRWVATFREKGDGCFFSPHG